jgi:prepilin-type N-terminal cleavage/methylation domain-containing protein
MRRRGLTLIELLIGLSLLAMVTGVFLSFLGRYQMSAVMVDGDLEGYQNSRVVLNWLVRDIRNSKGFLLSSGGQRLALYQAKGDIVYEFKGGRILRNSSPVSVEESFERVRFFSSGSGMVGIEAGIKSGALTAEAAAGG